MLAFRPTRNTDSDSKSESVGPYLKGECMFVTDTVKIFTYLLPLLPLVADLDVSSEPIPGGLPVREMNFAHGTLFAHVSHMLEIEQDKGDLGTQQRTSRAFSQWLTPQSTSKECNRAPLEGTT